MDGVTAETLSVSLKWDNFISTFMILYFFADPNEIQNFEAAAASSSTIRVTWSPPQCPYGVISEYRVYYRRSNVAQTGDISSGGYMTKTVRGSDRLEYIITGLDPYVNHAIHVQAVVGGSLQGKIEQELLVRTRSDVDPDFVDVMAPLPTDAPGPTTSRITISIRDPRDIDTGRVM